MAKSNQELTAKIQQAGAQAPAPTNGNGKQEPKSVADSLALYLAKPDVKQQMAMALPKHVTADRLARIALTTIRTTPALLECNVPSLMAAIMQSAQLGLEPGLLGHAYFVPFNRKIKGPGGDQWVKDVQFIIGYKGLLDLARRSGSIVTIAADAIYSNDKFLYRKGFEEKLEHEPNFQERGELIGFYAYATTKDGGRYATVMTKQDVDKIRSRSKAGQNGPWVTDYEEMGKKTVIRRLCKYLPLSIEVATQIREDEEKEFGQDVRSIELNLGSAPALPAPEQTIEVAQAALEAKREEIEYSADDLHFAETGEHLPNWDEMTEEEKEKFCAA